jgi:class 3 adenylate cyclase
MVRMNDAFLLEKKELELNGQTAQLKLQQQQIQLQSSQRNFLIAMAGILMLLAIGIFLRFSEVKKYNIALNAKNEALIAEQKRSEMLLLNILPVMVAEELKTSGNTKARRYEQATVMFTDFKDFSKIANSLAPEQLVAELDIYFKAFDEIISKYKIEKIKTIGDSYMCVGGLPEIGGSKPQDVVVAALEIQDLLAEFKEERQKMHKPYFEARIGIHTGPLVAGVVGSKKFAYDIWGDTVNIASRLETNGEARKVNISSATYELVKPYFKFEPRGQIAIKNLNKVDMYFVSERA